MSIWLLLVSVILIALSGAPGLLLSRWSNAGQWIAAAMNVIGSIVGAIGLILFAGTGSAATLSGAWSLPVGHFAIGIDYLSLVFIIPTLLISSLGSIFGLEYWPQAEHPGNGRKLRFCWGLLGAGMLLVVLARDSMLLLMAWEIMALATFFLMATEETKPDVRRAAWIYLIATHVGALCLIALFGLLRVATGSFDLWTAPASAIPAWLATSIFITGMIGFGLKAGIMPLHVWLPGAHANAPSHVSAILSGVLLKIGVYGMFRVAAIVPHPPVWWGITMLVVGCITGILGIAFAVAQHDFKRLLAYSSIENIGIITIGLGLALLGRTTNRYDWVVLGLGGALLHVLNHSLFKPLMFMGAGNLLHATHTRRIDLLGGLGRRMPRTLILMSAGAIAICGLPPFNGFVSEFFIYLGLFRTTATAAGGGIGHTVWIWAALAAPALAIIGALAVSAFVKLIGAAFLGSPRTAASEHAHDPGPLMLAPMALLAFLCALLGLLPILGVWLVEPAIAVWDPSPAAAGVSVRSVLPLWWFTLGGVLLVGGAWAGAVAIGRLRARSTVARAGTWDCGYLRPTPRIQYTGSSFGQMITDLLGWALLPRKTLPALRGVFPGRSEFNSEVPDTVLDRGLVPAFSCAERVLAWARPIQRGSVQVYLLYVLAAVLALLMFAAWG